MPRASAAIAWCLLLSLPTILVAKLPTKLPHLVYSNHLSYYLKSGEEWQPGENTQIVALMPDIPLVLDANPDLHGGTEEIRAAYLLYKCFTNEQKYQTVSLTHLDSNSLVPPVTLCHPGRPFNVTKVAGIEGKYNITLLRDNDIAYRDAMVHCLEFQLQIDFHRGSAQSASLFVYNLDALAKMNPTQVIMSGVSFTRHIFTTEALQFFTTLSGNHANVRNIQVIKLLDPEFLQLIRNTSILVRSALSVSVIIQGGRLCSDDLTLNEAMGDVVFTSGEGHEVIRDSIATLDAAHIELQKGLLVYSALKLSEQRSLLSANYPLGPIRVCLRIALNAPLWNYHLTLTVADRLNPTLFAAPLVNSTGPSCDFPDGRRHRWVVLIEGMQDVVLFNPIICTHSANRVSKISYENKECLNLISGSTTVMWQDCGEETFSIGRHGSIIVFNGVVLVRIAGAYTLAVAGHSFTYHVTVILLPRFNMAVRTGGLPHYTNAVLDSQVSFNCTVYHDGTRYLSLLPSFRVLPRMGLAKWRDLTLDQFADQILRTASKKIIQRWPQHERGQMSTSLFVVLPRVTIEWNIWILIYTCKATLAPREATFFGLPHYTVETHTDVLYYGSRIVSRRKGKSRVAPTVGMLPLLAVLLFISLSFH